MTPEDFPPVPAALLAALTRAFPDRFPNVPAGHAPDTHQISRLAGQLDVVRFLKAIHDGQIESPQG